jgi:SpoVK/Ycf46/Vps4 family AAA+-type ATPase
MPLRSPKASALETSATPVEKAAAQNRLSVQSIAQRVLYYEKAHSQTLLKTVTSARAAVSALWKEVRANKPAVIFVDECDRLFPKRGSGDGGQVRGAGNPTVDSSASWATLVLPE